MFNIYYKKITMNYKQKCLDIYYASDVVNKELTRGCEVMVSHWDKPVFVSTEKSLIDSEDNEHIHVCWGATMKKVYLKPYEHETKITEIIGHPPTGFDWLRLIGGIENPLKLDVSFPEEGTDISDYLWIFGIGLEEIDIQFNLTTNEPTDWESLYKILS